MTIKLCNISIVLLLECLKYILVSLHVKVLEIWERQREEIEMVKCVIVYKSW